MNQNNRNVLAILRTTWEWTADERTPEAGAQHAPSPRLPAQTSTRRSPSPRAPTEVRPWCPDVSRKAQPLAPSRSFAKFHSTRDRLRLLSLRGSSCPDQTAEPSRSAQKRQPFAFYSNDQRLGEERLSGRFFKESRPLCFPRLMQSGQVEVLTPPAKGFEKKKVLQSQATATGSGRPQTDHQNLQR